jgi:hypothetical protein
MKKELIAQIIVGIVLVLVVLFFDHIWQFVEANLGWLTVPGFSSMTDRLLLVIIALLVWIGWDLCSIKRHMKK